MKAISFEIKGNFGFFHWGKTKGDRRITNLFISRTEVLGILGAIIGLDGYSQKNFREKSKTETKPTFYEALSGLGVSILPMTMPELFEDHLIHREMKHINSRGSLMVEMTGLVQPSYKIFITKGSVENDVFHKVCTYLKNGWAEYIPYLGKNQFPMEVSHVKEENLMQVKNRENQVIHSLYKQEDVIKSETIRKNPLKKDDFHYSESLKNFKGNQTAQILTEQTIWSSFSITTKANVFETGDKENIVFL